MCSKESELTRQSLQQGLVAKRFGFSEEGDLSSTVGRRSLFCHLARDQPENLWISPTCGPWCHWSHLNMSKSAEHSRKEKATFGRSVWQSFLCSHQLSLNKHFHCEQPHGSNMLSQFEKARSQALLTFAASAISESQSLKDQFVNDLLHAQPQRTPLEAP